MNATVPLPLPAPNPVRTYVNAVWQRRFPIAGFVFAVALLSVGWALLMKPWYTAETTLLPPSENNEGFSNFASLIENKALARVGLFSTSSPSDVYVEILNSRRLHEAMVRKFDLMKVYDMGNKMDGTLKELALHVDAKAEATGIVAVSVEDTDKQRAADMANFLVSELDRFNRETLQTRGKRTRQFLEARIKELDQRMEAAEARLTQYERLHKVVVATDASAVQGLSDVVAKKLSLQVKRAYMESYSAPGSPSVKEMDAEIEAFDRELTRLPEVKNEGARLALDAEIQHKLFTFLTAQYEEARVEEMRDTPTVTVLDVARAPEVRTRPKRTFVVLGGAAFATALSLAWVWWTVRQDLRA